MRSLLLISLLVLTFSSLVRSDVYVSPTSGNDSATCGTSDEPCLTLSKALERAQDGDTLRLLEGVFSGNGNVPLKINTGRRLTFVAGEAAETMIDCSSVEGSDCVSVSVDRAGEDSFGSLWLQGISFTGFFPKDNRHSLISIASSVQSRCDSSPLGQEDSDGDNPADITISHCAFRDNQYQSQMGSPTRLGRLIEVDASLVSSLTVDISFTEFIDNKIPVSSINSATTTFRFCLFRNIRNSLTNNVTPLILETYAPSGSPQFTQLYRSQISFEDCWFDQNIDGSSGSSPLLFFDAKNFFTSFLRCTFSSNQASSLIDFEGLALQISDSTMTNNQMGRVAIHSGVPSTRAQAPIVDLLNVSFESEFSNRTLRILSGSFSSSSIVSLTANCPVVERLVDESLINIEAGAISIRDSNFVNCSCAIRSYPSTYVKIENCNFDVNKVSGTSELALVSATGKSVSAASDITTIVIHQSTFSSASDNKDIKYLSLQGSANLLVSNSTFDDGKKVVKCTQITSNDEDDEALVQFIGAQTTIASNRLLMTDYAGSNCQFVCSNSNGEMCNTLRSSWIFPILFFLTSLFAIGVSGAYLKLSYSQP